MVLLSSDAALLGHVGKLPNPWRYQGRSDAPLCEVGPPSPDVPASRLGGFRHADGLSAAPSFATTASATASGCPASSTAWRTWGSSPARISAASAFSSTSTPTLPEIAFSAPPSHWKRPV